MLHFRNTYKNCKIMLLYCALAILCLVLSAFALLIAFIEELSTLGIILCVIFTLGFFVNYFLLRMKNNDYKLKNYFKLFTFYKQAREFRKLFSKKHEKKLIRQIIKQQKDYFLQSGVIVFNMTSTSLEKNEWNDWLEEASEFKYDGAKYMEKLSYLFYALYDACAGGSGLEKFFESVYSYKEFSGEELIEVFLKNDFLSNDFKRFLVSHINDYSKENKDELYARYEKEDDKEFFAFETEIYDNAKWLACNRRLLSSAVGIYIHKEFSFEILRLFLSKDYTKVIFIYIDDNGFIKVSYRQWDWYNSMWDLVGENANSIYDDEKSAYNDIKNLLEDYIELKI